MAKIVGLEAFPIEMPWKHPFRIATALYTTQPYVIIKLYTDFDVVGYGEACPCYEFTGETIGTVMSILKDRIFPSIRGEDAFNIEVLTSKMDEATVGNASAKGAVDMAVYDVIGKTLNQPVYNVLGGRVRDEVLYSGGASITTAEETVEACVRDVSKGIRELKIKVGEDPTKDAEKIRRVREAVGPGVQIRVDANQGWITPHRAIKAIRLMERCELQLVEQPILSWNLKGLGHIRKKVDVPIMLDESVHTSKDAVKAIEAEACDIINVKLMKSGGMFEALKINAVSEASGVDCFMGGMGETSIGQAAALHVIASRGNIKHADVELPADEWGLEEDIASGLEQTKADDTLYMKIPSGSGLGVQVNDEIIRKHLIANPLRIVD
jgi:L-alanine-DL-glutamate epimerase-like enolase superfamily enzyme